MGNDCGSYDGAMVAHAQGAIEHVPVAGTASVPPAAPPEERFELEPILTAIVQSHVAAEERLPGQQPIVIPHVWYSDTGDVLNVELGKAYLPTDYTITFEEQVNAIVSLLITYTQQRTPIYNVDVWFEGKDIFFYFPEERGPEDRVVPKSVPEAKHRPKRDLGNGRVLVSAGHGVYYNSRYKDWRAQRDPVNHMVEDFSTPAFARRLERFLVARGGAEVIQARSDEGARHVDSDMPWHYMAARYHIQAMLPELPSVWNSPGKSALGMEERDQDIRSRPLFANHLGVDAAIHLHTNADASPETRGIRVFHHVKSPESKHFAGLALCYMKESLSSNAFYANFPILSHASRENHAENRLADMASIIAELGFHTNKDDADAIQSDSFQVLTMRGLEKAYRMFKQGNGCVPFGATYSDVTVMSDSTAEASITFAGFPRFPVRLESVVAECPSGVMCWPLAGYFKEPTAPLAISHSCLAKEPFTMKWNVRFIDADGISARTTAVMHCKPKAKTPS
ncbi:N-acetylmuramoyl-L-alanine amidase [Luteibacter sp. W1I16]